MPLKNCSRLAATALLATSLSAFAQEPLLLLEPDQPQIKIRVVDVEPKTGVIEVSIFDSAESFMKEPLNQVKINVSAVTDSEASFTYPPAGVYSVVVVHDANENGELDRGFLGIGGEGYGFSNNVRPWFGWPSFEETSFTVESSGTEIEISLK